jgi:uncharacterized protein YjbJ (UPF0337 family)
MTGEGRGWPRDNGVLRHEHTSDGKAAHPAQTPPDREEIRMTDKNVDETKGRVKEAAGSLLDDDSLRREGQADQAKASVKDTVDKVADKVKSAFDR